MHVRWHGENVNRLFEVLSPSEDLVDVLTLYDWRNGVLAPRGAEGLRLLGAIEHRYRHPAGYFRAKLPNSGRATINRAFCGLPDNFDRLGAGAGMSRIWSDLKFRSWRHKDRSG